MFSIHVTDTFSRCSQLSLMGIHPKNILNSDWEHLPEGIFIYKSSYMKELYLNNAQIYVYMKPLNKLCFILFIFWHFHVSIQCILNMFFPHPRSFHHIFFATSCPFSYKSLSLIKAAHIHMDMQSATGAWTSHQEPTPGKSGCPSLSSHHLQWSPLLLAELTDLILSSHHNCCELTCVTAMLCPKNSMKFHFLKENNVCKL